MASNYSGGRRTTEVWNKAPKSKLEIADDLLRKRQSNLRNWWSDESQARGRNQQREDKLSKTAHERAMELAKLKEAGETGRTGMRQKGAFDVANRRQSGATNRTGLTERGLNTRQGKALDQSSFFTGQKSRADMFTTILGASGDKVDPVTGQITPGRSFESLDAQFKTFMGGGPEISQDRLDALGGAQGVPGLQRQDSVTRADGTKQLFDQRGELIDTPEVQQGAAASLPRLLGIGRGVEGRGQPAEASKYKDYYDYIKRTTQIGKKRQPPPPAYVGLPWQK